ncbi:hypothetical protein SDC9_112478 [bioreactor metagenome]|uniref:Uncharacterized protein n=1 Tax=bioreactor metagenome TaxID=1076179 RepID=A0A645BM13_9ZZZZ
MRLVRQRQQGNDDISVRHARRQCGRFALAHQQLLQLGKSLFLALIEKRLKGHDRRIFMDAIVVIGAAIDGDALAFQKSFHADKQVFHECHVFVEPDILLFEQLAADQKSANAAHDVRFTASEARLGDDVRDNIIEDAYLFDGLRLFHQNRNGAFLRFFDIIAHADVRLRSHKCRKHPFVHVRIHPVIRIDESDILPGRCAQTVVSRFRHAAVQFVNQADPIVFGS